MDIEALKRVSEVRRMLASGEAAQVREGLCVSIREVAGAMGADPGTVSRWFAGQTQPRTGAALQLAEFLGIASANHIPEKAA
ncbi:helix-turn-helix domain-containing protein [Streptomyces sp. IBSBF 2435]|uniref:helix-turn-helix domain-containing protein n=1 Tax=Streptomyces sp. IBSBF 2435 TaxID=2903531 RepID=UPI002FDC379F